MILTASGIAQSSLPAAEPAGHFGSAKQVLGIGNPGEWDFCLSVQPDGLSAVFFSDGMLFEATRASTDEPFEDAQAMGPTVNTTAGNLRPVPGPTLTADGLVMIYARGPVGGSYWEQSKLFEARRVSPNAPFGEAVPLPNAINEYTSLTPSLSPDGLLLLFASSRPSGRGDMDIWVAARDALDAPFAEPVNFDEFFPDSEVNSPYEDIAPCLSADRLALFFSDLGLLAGRPGTRGGPDIWISTRPDTDSPFGPPQNLNNFGLGSTLNSAEWEGFPILSSDWPAPGSKLYFTHRVGTEIPLDTQFWEADWAPFRFTEFRPMPDGLQMDFTTKPNQTFQVQYSDALSQPNWKNLGDPVTATDDSASITDPQPVGNGTRFYRALAP